METKILLMDSRMDSRYSLDQEEIFRRRTRSFYNVPDSPASNYIMETLNAGTNQGDLGTRKGLVTRGTNVKVTDTKNGREITFSRSDSEVVIQISDIDKLAGTNKSVKKLFLLTMIKANEQALHSGELVRNFVSFPVQELIDIGFYSTVQSAKKGFLAGTDILTSMKIKGQLKDNAEGKGPSVSVLEVPFTGAMIKKGQCTIYLNPRINWSFLSQYYTILPSYYFKLSNRGSELLYYIFYLARQNVDKIKNRGYFTISFRAIQQRLMLPSETENREPGKTIMRPIEEAIEQIETLHNKYYKNTDLQLLPVYDPDGRIKDFLDNGYLKVTMDGTLADVFITLCNDKDKQIESAKKRKQKIIDSAKEKALVHKLEKEAEAGAAEG